MPESSIRRDPTAEWRGPGLSSRYLRFPSASGVKHGGLLACSSQREVYKNFSYPWQAMRALGILEMLPPRTNPLVAIAEVDNPVIEVTMVERRIMRTPRPVSNER